MSVTRIFLIRHGATVLTAEDRFAGATDVELSDEGRGQVRRLAERLSLIPVDAVYASPLGRTMETARILAAPHAMEVQARDGLREISHGHWEQMTRKEVEAAYPDEAALNIVDFKDPVRARLMLFNDSSHYSECDLALPATAGACLSKWWTTDPAGR